MSVEIRNTRNLLGGNMKLKLLVIGKSRLGKTTFVGSVPGVGVAACEVGHGQGLLSIASQGVDYFSPTCLEDIDALASGHIFKDKDAIAIDSLSAVVRTLVKNYALKMPGGRNSTPQRAQGIPELKDYGTMAEVTRRILEALLNLDKHIIVTALEKTERDHETGAAISCGPDLPGQMYAAAPSMFDSVLYLKARKALLNPNDAKSAYTQRYFLTQPDGFHIGGDRNNIDGKPILAAEEIFDPATNRGTFSDIYQKITAAYAARKAA